MPEESEVNKSMTIQLHHKIQKLLISFIGDGNEKIPPYWLEMPELPQ